MKPSKKDKRSQSLYFLSLITIFLIFLLSFSLNKSIINQIRLKKEAFNANLDSCDPFQGKWVYDNKTPPLYSGLGCSFMSDEVACEKYGRKDLMYQNWRWKPNGCDLPRFDGKVFLEKLRNKRMVYVGDSLNRNDWASMVCMVESFIPLHQKSLSRNGSLISFKAKEFNASIDFYWSPLLVESNCDHLYNHRVSSRIIRSSSIKPHAKNWMNADILVFNSYLWWRKPNMKMQVLYDPFGEDRWTYTEVEMREGFQLALDTWSNWLQFNTNTSEKQIFFVSLSPTHALGEDWGSASNQNCYKETEPITKEGFRGSGSDYRIAKMVEITIENLRNKGVKVQILNITQLSEYRKDAHPSIYRKFWGNLSDEQIANPSSYSDCIHWCLPGLPDVWNEILYYYIISNIGF